MVADALRAGPGEQEWTGTQEAHRWVRKCSYPMRGVFTLAERSEVFASLSTDARIVFFVVFAHLGRGRWCWPSQGRIGRLTGLSERRIRDVTDELVTKGVLTRTRVRRLEGGWHLLYELGPQTLAALDATALVEFADPSGAGEEEAAAHVDSPRRRRAKTVPRPPERPSYGAGLRPAYCAEEGLLKLEGFCCEGLPTGRCAPSPPTDREKGTEQENQFESSGGERREAPQAPKAPPVLVVVEAIAPPVAEQPPELGVAHDDIEAAPPPPALTAEDFEIARVALAHHAKRRRPRVEPPTWWDRVQLAMVARTVSLLNGTRDEKIAAELAAVEGAFAASTDRLPTVKFIWSEAEHFLDHVERGRRAAAVAEHRARMQAAQEARRRAESNEGGVRPPPSLASQEVAPTPEESPAAPAAPAPSPRDPHKTYREQRRAEEDDRRRAMAEARQVIIERERAKGEAAITAEAAAPAAPTAAPVDLEAQAAIVAELEAMLPSAAPHVRARLEAQIARYRAPSQ